MWRFWSDEQGEIPDYLVLFLIGGLSALPIIAGIVNALRATHGGQVGRVTGISQSGY